jgi:MFS transporter, putative metabolite:H+ symporter
MSSAPRLPAGSLLSRLDESEFTPRHLRIYVALLLGHFLCGFVINLTGVVVPGIVREMHVSPAAAGLLSTALFAGMLVGAAGAGMVSDRWGRKVPLAACLMLFALFSLLAAFVTSFGALVACRAVQGVGLGAEIAVVLPYIAEFVPSRHRGPLVTTATAAWLIGLPVAAAVGAAVVPAFGWRAMFVISTVPVLVGLGMLAWLPESVRYLVGRQRTEAAHTIVDRLCPGTGGPPDPWSEPEPVREPEPRGSSLGALLRRRYRPYTLAIWFMELCAGAFLFGLSSWLPSVLEKQGVGLLTSFAYTAIITAVGVVGAVLAGQLINRVGRRTVLGASFIASGLLCLVWGLSSNTVAVVVLGSAATFFGSGLAGSTLFAYASELYPTAARGTGLGWAAAWQKVGGLVMPPILGLVLAATTTPFVFFLIFGVLSVLAGLVALAATFETRGRTVEQITREIAGHDDPLPHASLAGRTTLEGP